MKTCQYRNCNKQFEGPSTKKFCCNNHRKMEFTFESRDKKRLSTEKKRIRSIISMAAIDQKTIDLYKKLYR